MKLKSTRFQKVGKRSWLQNQNRCREVSFGCKCDSPSSKLHLNLLLRIFRGSGSTVRFTLGPSLYGHEASLFINSPPEANVPFIRLSYRQLKWQYHFTEYADEGNAFVDCTFSTAGTFRFFVTLDGRLSPFRFIHSFFPSLRLSIPSLRPNFEGESRFRRNCDSLS